jgi:hypothetical protein
MLNLLNNHILKVQNKVKTCFKIPRFYLRKEIFLKKRKEKEKKNKCKGKSINKRKSRKMQ